MSSARRRKHTVRERAAAVAKARELGVSAAARHLGISKANISRWRRMADEDVAGNAQQVPGSDGGGAAAASAPSTAPQTPSRRVQRVYTPSERARILEHADKHGPSAAEKEFGCTRWSIREWRRKARLHAEGKADTSPVVGSDEDSAVERDRRVLAVWRKHPGLGPSQIRNQLRRAGLKVSVHTVRVTMEEHGYVPPKVRKKEVHDERYEAVRPNQMWHADFLHRYINRLPVYVLLLIDDFSRFIVGWELWDAERVAAVIETFERAVARHGRPESMMSDGGSGFWSWRGVGQFTKRLEEYDIDQLIAKTPQVNGKLEILNANVQKELFNVDRFFDLAETRRRLEAWVDFYNFKRTHHALGGLLVPADRYHGRADRVLAAIESGRSADGIGEPVSVAARLLDLLRVTSRGGQLEVTLLGQRLWPT